MAASSEDKVREIVCNIIHCDARSLSLTSTWKDLKADSLDLVQILVALEEAFGLEISDQDAEKLRSLGDLVAYVDGVVAQRAKVG